MLDLQKFTAGLHDYMARALQPLAARIKALEDRPCVPGRDGRDGVQGPPDEKGVDGVNGKDGIGFDDLTVEYDGERCFTLKFSRGDEVREFPFTLPVVIDRGVHKTSEDYGRGDAVTFGGSLWIAQKDFPTDKPGQGDGWRLAVKKGRDAR